MQNQSAAPNHAFGMMPPQVNVDVVATPEKARSWIRVCRQFPQIAESSQDLFLAAQLTLLGIGEQPVLV